MKNQRPISEQIEHEDIPFLDDLDPEPTDVPFDWLAFCVPVLVIILFLVAVFA